MLTHLLLLSQKRLLPFFLLTSYLSLLTILLVRPAFSQQRWERNYGGTGADYGYSVKQTQDGGYIVAGWTASFGNSFQVYLIKTNVSGDTLWTRTYGGTNDDRGYSVQQTSDTGYIVAGATGSYGGQVYLVKTNATGDTLWTKTYGGTDYDYGFSVQQTSDTGYIIAGFTHSFGNGDQVYLIKTNASGDTLWTRNYGGTGEDRGLSIQQTSDMGYIVAGYTWSFGDSAQVYLIKTNATGDTLWTRNYGGTGGDRSWSVQQTSDTGYIVAGYTYSFGNLCQVYLVKTNASGDTIWTRTHGGAGYDEGYSVRQTSDGGYIVAGYTSSFGNGWQVYLVKTDANGNSGAEENTEVRGQKLEVRITAKPNPFTSFATLPGHEAERFGLYDVSGRKVGTFRGDRVGEGLSAGVYFLKPDKGVAKPLRIVKLR